MPIIWPGDNPYSPLKAELGRLLFFDTRLSADGTVSCATCTIRSWRSPTVWLSPPGFRGKKAIAAPHRAQSGL